MTPEVINRIIGMTPCLCGSIETWHDRCYAGKSQAQINAGYKRAYRIAAEKIKDQAAAEASAAIARIAGRTAK